MPQLGHHYGVLCRYGSIGLSFDTTVRVLRRDSGLYENLICLLEHWASHVVEITRQIALPAENGRAPLPTESRKSSQSVNPYSVWGRLEFWLVASSPPWSFAAIKSRVVWHSGTGLPRESWSISRYVNVVVTCSILLIRAKITKCRALNRVPPGHGKSWNLERPFSRPRKSWKIAKVMENDDNVMEFLLLHWAIL